MDLAFSIARTRCAHDSLVLSLRKRKRLGRKPRSSSCALDPSSRSLISQWHDVPHVLLNGRVGRGQSVGAPRAHFCCAISIASTHPRALGHARSRLLSSPSPLLKFCPTACAAAAVAAQAAAVAMYTAAAVVADCTRTSKYAQHEQVRTFRVC